MMVTEKKMSNLAARLYMLGAAVIPHAIILFDRDFLSWYFLTFFVCFAPGFFICFFAFLSLDWGLKKLWLERSWLGLIPLIVLISAMFLLAIVLQNQASAKDWLIMVTWLGMILIWSGFVVALQLSDSAEEKAKHGDS